MKTRLSLLALLLFVASSSFAQQNERPKNGDRPRMEQREPGDQLERMAKFLDLTDDQKTKIEALQVPHMKKMLAFKNQLDEKQAQKKTLMSADKPDQTKINSLIDEVSKIEASSKKEMANHQLEIRALLTEKQKVKFDTMKQRKEKRPRKNNK